MTGYRPFGDYENYRLVNEFEERAVEIQRELKGDWRAEQQAMAELVDDFISAINVNIEEYGKKYGLLKEFRKNGII